MGIEKLNNLIKAIREYQAVGTGHKRGRLRILPGKNTLLKEKGGLGARKGTRMVVS